MLPLEDDYDRPPLLQRPLGSYPPHEPQYEQYEDEMHLGHLGPHDSGFLRNPYILGGLVVGFAVIFAVLLSVVSSGGGDGGGNGGNNGGNGGVSITPLTPLPGRGLPGESISIATVREGPGLDYSPIGELARGQAVEVIGRNSDNSWFEIFYPLGSTLRGWVPDSGIEIDGELTLIPLASVTPIARPTLDIPTPTEGPEETPTETPTPTATGTPSGGIDLAVSLVSGTCEVGSEIGIIVTNLGPDILEDETITVLIQSVSGAQELIEVSVTLQPGESIDMESDNEVEEPVLVTVDPFGEIGDPNDANNRINCGVAVTPGPGDGNDPEGTPSPVVPPPIN
jgi:hypothetical protein